MFGSVETFKPYPRQLDLRLIKRGEQAQFDDLMAKHHPRVDWIIRKTKA